MEESIIFRLEDLKKTVHNSVYSCLQCYVDCQRVRLKDPAFSPHKNLQGPLRNWRFKWRNLYGSFGLIEEVLLLIWVERRDRKSVRSFSFLLSYSYNLPFPFVFTTGTSPTRLGNTFLTCLCDDYHCFCMWLKGTVIFESWRGWTNENVTNSRWRRSSIGCLVVSPSQFVRLSECSRERRK